MNAEILNIESRRAGDRAEPQLRTLVVCDIADSTALVERMGDQSAANIIRKHDRLARALVEQHRGREIDKTDGFLLLFDRPIQAVAFALDYQRGLKHLSAAEGVILRARVGIHMGDVVIWENAPEDVARGAKPIEVEGLVKPVAARLAQLARPQQTLMSIAAAGIARRAQSELARDLAARVHWKEHGRYRFKGLPEPLEVFEVGEDKIAPFHAPISGRTAKKILPWWRRPLTLAAEAAMLAIGIGFGVWFLLQSPPTLAFGQRDWVVVGDLHNLTGDPRFNQSLETALHISLEQSQYVNVVPELSVQQTLQRMERDPDKTKVTRVIGSEIALRDGARALILPTLAEVGGRVRVTAEVVDPNTQTTVYSVSADGTGAQSVLPSLDSVSKQLRGKLGEALAMVSKNSQPLDKVATSNLDALRAYSLGVDAHAIGDSKDAEALFQHAIELDPGFARARIDLASTLFDANQRDSAMDQLRAAAKFKDRMTQRDSMLVSASLATYNSARDGLQKWKLLADLYPDMFAASGHYGYYAWMYFNNFDVAKAAIARSASPLNPNRVNSDFMLGVLALGQEQYSQAMKHLALAESEGWRRTEYIAAAYAAQRKYKDAARAMERAKSSGIASDDIDTDIVRISIALDQGRWSDTLKLLDSAATSARDVDRAQIRRFASVRLSLDNLLSLSSTKVHEEDPSDQSSDPESSPSLRADVAFQQTLRAYLVARNGNIHQATALLKKSDAARYSADFPILHNMFDVASAEILREQGRPDAAIKLIDADVDGSELYVTHVVLMDSYTNAKEYPSALREAKWLANHRGRAYAEYNQAWTLTPFNIAQSDLAVLESAELAFTMGDKRAARADLSNFLSIWPDAGSLPTVREQVQKLTRQLAGN